MNLLLILLALLNVSIFASSKNEDEKKWIEKNVSMTCQTVKNFEQNYECVKSEFVLGGSFINPLIIKDLSTSIEDRGDQIIGINLIDSQNSNKYYLSTVKVNDNWIGYERDGESFYYKKVDVLKNSYNVLMTKYNGGGMSTFYSLLIVNVTKGNGLSINGDKVSNVKRLIIEKIAEIGIGDRFSGIIEVKDNKILKDKKLLIDLPPNF